LMAMHHGHMRDHQVIALCPESNRAGDRNRGVSVWYSWLLRTALCVCYPAAAGRGPRR
jgi:hypothetical protein